MSTTNFPHVPKGFPLEEFLSQRCLKLNEILINKEGFLPGDGNVLTADWNILLQNMEPIIAGMDLHKLMPAGIIIEKYITGCNDYFELS